jgi:hypothetical protein
MVQVRCAFFDRILHSRMPLVPGGGEGVGSGGGGNEQSVQVMNHGQLFLVPLDWGDRAPRNNVSGW